MNDLKGLVNVENARDVVVSVAVEVKVVGEDLLDVFVTTGFERHVSDTKVVLVIMEDENV